MSFFFIFLPIILPDKEKLLNFGMGIVMILEIQTKALNAVPTAKDIPPA